jgi:selenocysteine lyase/cysteine desulfurase
VGIDRVAAHDQELVQQLLEELNPGKFDVVSPRELPRRSTLVFLSHKDRARNRSLHAHLRANQVEVAYRRGQLRLAPHLYNTKAEMDRALKLLNEA